MMPLPNTANRRQHKNRLKVSGADKKQLSDSNGGGVINQACIAPKEE
ncbi:MAG: hypothetical protein VXZ96_06355 [Myxococcota bacterium]|nr:hypothetical protein [Myxococcota bacterium]